MSRISALLAGYTRPMLEEHLPEWVRPRWYTNDEELLEHAPDADIGWFDGFDPARMHEVIARAEKLRWLNTIAAGVDPFPLDLLRERSVLLTNGAGMNAITIAEYAVLGMLTIAKGYREVVKAQLRHEWLEDAPGKQELYGSSALIIGAGGIGGRLGRELINGIPKLGRL